MRQQPYLAQLYICTCTDSYRDWQSYFRFKAPLSLDPHSAEAKRLTPRYGEFEISDRASPWFICRSRPRKGHSRERVRTRYRRDSKIDRASQIAVEKGVQNVALHYVTCYVAATASILLNRYISSFFYMICFNLLENH